MLTLDNVKFPVYKLRQYINMEHTLLDVIKIQTIKGTYILDDTSLSGTFAQRRLQLRNHYSELKPYKLKDQILYLRQLIKYPSKTKFIDSDGHLFEYNKGKKFFKVKSYKITRYNERNNWGYLYLDSLEQPFMVTQPLTFETKYASIMHTDKGLLLYDLTKEYHKPYNRKL
jgi:hypothetical protein